MTSSRVQYFVSLEERKFYGQRQDKKKTDCFHGSCDESEFEKRTEAREMGQHNKQARKSS